MVILEQCQAAAAERLKLKIFKNVKINPPKGGWEKNTSRE